MDTHNRQKEYGLNLIIDRLTGSLSDEADLALREWICASDANRLYAEKIEQLWGSLDLVGEAVQYDSERAFSLFKQRVGEDTDRLYLLKKNTRSFSFRKWTAYAAVLVSFLVLSYFTYGYFQLKAESGQVALVSEIVVPNGSKTQLTLQDGSKVWLNAGSTIQYDSNYGKEFRLLKLTGEAYLEVVGNEQCPFIVDAGDVKVKVLGTRFNVNAYADNEEIKVALLQGAIEMKAGNSPALQLKPKDVASFNTVSKEINLYQNSHYSGNAIDWINSRLIFNGESFEQIIHTLERSFNVKINIRKESVKKRRFIGDFVNNETIEQIFNVMSADGKFRYTINGNVIDVY